MSRQCGVRGDDAERFLPLEHLFAIVRRDRKLHEDGARKAMINVFNMLAGNPDFAELVSSYRRQLATALN